jgi:hypothetical protein
MTKKEAIRTDHEQHIAWLRTDPPPNQHSRDNPADHAKIEECKRIGRENVRLMAIGRPRLTPYDQTDAYALCFEAACYPSREQYPPELEDEFELMSGYAAAFERDDHYLRHPEDRKLRVVGDPAHDGAGAAVETATDRGTGGTPGAAS